MNTVEKKREVSEYHDQHTHPNKAFPKMWNYLKKALKISALLHHLQHFTANLSPSFLDSSWKWGPLENDTATNYYTTAHGLNTTLDQLMCFEYGDKTGKYLQAFCTFCKVSTATSLISRSFQHSQGKMIPGHYALMFWTCISLFSFTDAGQKKCKLHKYRH